MLERPQNKEFVTNGPIFKFVYVIHTKEHTEETLQMIQDCDVILMEETGMSTFEREHTERKIAGASRKFWPNKRIKEYVTSRRNIDWGFGVLAHVIEENKEFYYIDLPPNSVARKIREESSVLYTKSFQTFLNRKPTEAVKLFRKYMESLTESTSLRNLAVMQQIKDLHKAKGDKWNNKTIAILQGVGHENTYDMFKTNYPEYEIDKITMESQANIIQLSIDMERHPNKELKDQDLIRVMFSPLIILPYLSVWNPTTDTEEIDAISEKTAKSLTDEEIEFYWNAITYSENHLEPGKAGDEAYQKLIYGIGYSIFKTHNLEKSDLNG